MEHVKWEDSKRFCDTLSRNPEERGNRYRLPSEAEWEYACRAGSQGRFHYGNDTKVLHKYVWYYYGKTNGYGSHPVATKPANSWGLFDMNGNLSEWCQDVWSDNYEGAPTDGSARTAGPDPSRHVIRGGSWGYPPKWCRSAYRETLQSAVSTNTIGFRVAIESFGQ